MTRREILLSSASGMLAQNAVGAAGRAPVVNGAEHAWTVHDPRFPIQPRLAVCPNNLPDYDYSAEYLLSEMHTWRVDHVVISHVCYYGRDNSYPSYCVKKYPGKFAAIGMLVGLIREDGLVGLRLSPIYNREVVWLNDPVCYPL